MRFMNVSNGSPTIRVNAEMATAQRPYETSRLRLFFDVVETVALFEHRSVEFLEAFAVFTRSIREDT
jgi:hypothetical protein